MNTLYSYMHNGIGEMHSIFSRSFSCCGNIKLQNLNLGLTSFSSALSDLMKISPEKLMKE